VRIDDYLFLLKNNPNMRRESVWAYVHALQVKGAGGDGEHTHPDVLEGLEQLKRPLQDLREKCYHAGWEDGYEMGRAEALDYAHLERDALLEHAQALVYEFHLRAPRVPDDGLTPLNRGDTAHG
jgi:hypothetical protein